MDDAAREYVAELDRRLADARGVYVVGSAALGGYEPGRSDLDVLVVVDAPLSGDERRAIVARCSHDALPCPARKLELVVYTAEQVAAPRRDQPFELNLNTGADEPLHAGSDPAAEPWHWFVLDLAQAREHAIALHGPPAREVIGAVPRELVMDAMAELLAWYARNEPGEQLVLAAARAWHYAETGAFVPKREALTWAARRAGR
ncbi:MAG: nucleotidyltransferase domain-containing protein [Actinomycetota bacterium]|nr:nucleotidyltransferase domain-containing protein [Actinomycetota bacterium]